MRGFLPVPLLLAGCGGDGGTPAETGAIGCAVGDMGDFQPVCTIERDPGEGGRSLIVRHPDGGFRRLLITSDGRGVTAGDGAEQARVTPISDKLIEVELGGDRYRLPATVRPGAGAAK